MEDLSRPLFQGVLPPEWVIHEYRPDYGIDLVVELFKFVDEKRTISETLGEMFFVQLKSIDGSSVERVTVRPRYNVEKRSLSHDPSVDIEIEVIKFQIDVGELLTIQSMGAAIPVLLVLVVLDSKKVYFVCLNDLIDKVLLPSDPEFHLKEKKTILIPLKNEIANQDQNLVPLRFYAKRPKLYAAFSKFAYQRRELEYTREPETVNHFIKVIRRYDFWENTPEWSVIAEMREQIEQVARFVEGSGRSSSEQCGSLDGINLDASKMLRAEWDEQSDSREL